jgi:uncharacterized membrane protein YphA (DoxX/SURF4 family)
MKSLGFLLFLLAAGPGFLWRGIRSLQTRAWESSVPALEYLIDRAAGIEPPPRNAWDRHFARFQAWMLVLFGTFFSLCGLAVLISFVSE